MATGSDAFGALLRRHRLSSGLSQEALAEQAGLSARGISALERGVSQRPRRDTLDLLIGALKLSAGQKSAFQAAADGGGARSTDARRGAPGLAQPLSSLVGREQELTAVQDLLVGRESVRLVTLIGPAGVGKTRLALVAAASLRTTYSGAVCVVELASLTNPDLVPQAAIHALGVRLATETSHGALDALATSVARRRALLVLDNCEHLTEACRRLADALLRRCPRLRILATSRSALGVPGEQVWSVPPLSVPPLEALRTPTSPERLLQYAAVRLFMERAGSIEPDFTITPQSAEHVAKICRRLDGLPLAIELAAARVRVLAVAQIAHLLVDPFRLLTGGSRTAPPRQQSLRAALDWSYGLLPARAHALLRRLSVFAGGCTLETAKTICAGDEGAQPLTDGDGETKGDGELDEPGDILDLLSH
ncbi:MAG TPA: helix-turn-helix domain-containing protein, partial [Chloroflexota bacterium]|nr:helix-turn-helix domain-containing protein [Chloroflexota bacterium]